ncbi:EF hand [Phytophthora infestans]|uniref:EF hand n=1 Tax=Phytophthora infestans TaxID=4787 RepID=A0A8S9V0K2_PHYIN|nr:EF hand [Phytophthora infestans]
MALSTQGFSGTGESNREMSSLTQWKERQQQCAEQVDLQALLTNIRASLRSQGLVAWVNMSLALEKAQSESGGVTNGVLKRLLNDSRVSTSDVDARALVQRVNQNAEEDGRVTADAVRNLIFGALSGRKLEFVQSAFEALDRKGVGYLALQDVLAAHDAGRHPAVMFGEQTTEQAAREFQTSFMTAARRTGTAFVSWAQWLTYFQCVAAQAPSDEYFELLMKRVWRADMRRSLQEAAGAADLNARMDSIPPPPTPASVVPVSLYQALQQNQGTSSKAKVVLSISTSASPREQHRSSSLILSPMDPDASPRGAAVRSTNEFLKGSQLAACLTEVTSPPSTRSGAAGPSVETLDPGAASVLRKVQTGLRARGIQALVELGRCLRLSDADGNGKLTLGEFRRALQSSHEATSPTTVNNPPLSDADLRGIFLHLDVDRMGIVPVEAALDLVRGTMSSRRLRHVHAAYQTLARETGASFLAACDVVQRYDASRHPDVIAQRKSEEQCFREFVENFDMDENSGEGAGNILPRQWEAYYHNVSFLVPDDDLFELIVRNTWHLPSTGDPAHKSRAPPPVHIESPLGSAFAGNSIRHLTPTNVNGEVTWRGKRSFGTGMASQQAFAILQPDVVDRLPVSGVVSPSSAMNLAPPGSPGAANKQSKELRRMIHSLRCELKERGLGGFIALQQQLRRAAGRSDEDYGDELNDGNIGFHDFVRALKSSGVHVTGRDAQSLFFHFDSNHDGTMSVTEFLTGVREPMNTQRQLVVRMAFDALDRLGSGDLAAAAIADAFDARRLPEVTSGRKTECEAHAEFLDTFGLVTECQRQRRVNFDVWERYYANVSAAVDEDEQFELMLRNSWHLGPSTGGRVARAAPGEKIRGIHRQDPGRSSVHEILDHTAAYTSNPTLSSSGSSPSMTLRRAKNNVSSCIAACLGNAPSTQPPIETSGLTSPGSREFHLHPAGVQAILSRLKQVLQAQGASGFCTLNRRLRAARGNAMNLQDLRTAAADCELTLPGGLTDADLRLMFQYLDNDGDGRIAPDELINIVRPALTGRRLECVREAFAKLAKVKSIRDVEKASLEPSDVVEQFDASAHPDVVAGRRGVDLVCREFLESFDIDGSAQDGKVTWKQWRGYYHNVSASIPSHREFEEMVCSVWHLDGSDIKSDADVEPPAPPQQQDNQRNRGNGTISSWNFLQPAAAGARTAFATTEAPVQSVKERKILSLKEVAAGTAMIDANRLTTSRGPPLGVEAVPTYAGDSVLHAIRYRIRQSNSLANVVQLRTRLNQSTDPRTGIITSARCCEALNAALGISLGELQGHTLFEHLSNFSQSNGNGSTTNERFPHEHRVNGLPLRLILDCLLERLSPASLASATKVYTALQSSGNGRVFPAALASSFQAAKHPDVVLGRCSAAQIFQDFALSFEVAGGNGVVTFQHFETYCVNLRATLGSEELLQLVLRDCF